MAIRNTENVTYNGHSIKPFKVIQGHIFWGHWKGDKGLNNTT